MERDVVIVHEQLTEEPDTNFGIMTLKKNLSLSLFIKKTVKTQILYFCNKKKKDEKNFFVGGTIEAHWKCMGLHSQYKMSGNNIIIIQEFKNLHKWQTIDVEGIIASTEY